MTSGLLESFQTPYNQFSEHDKNILERLVNQVDKGLFCEIGCWTGHSTSIIARRVKEINSSLYVIDTFKGNDGTPLKEFATEKNIKNIFINNMKELGVYENIWLFDMMSLEAAQHFSDNIFSFLFIDAAHDYNNVKSDITLYLPKMKKGSIICGHDYESDTYDEANIHEDYVNGKHHGVIKAVNEVFGVVEHDGRMWWKQL